MDLSQKILEEEQTKRRARWEEISGPLYETKWKERISELKKRTRRERIKAVNEEIAVRVVHAPDDEVDVGITKGVQGGKHLGLSRRARQLDDQIRPVGTRGYSELLCVRNRGVAHRR